MSQQVIVKVKPDGSTEVRTEGFTGSSCKLASQFIERALGLTQSEQLTADYFRTGIEAGQIQTQQGDE